MSAHRRRRRPLPAPPPLIALLTLVCALVGLAPPVAAVPLPASAAVEPGSPALPAGPATPPVAARAGTPSPEPSPAEDADDPAVGVAVTSLTPQVVRPDDELVVRARIHNDTDDPLESVRAVLRVNRFLLSTRSSLQQWVGQPLDGTAGSRLTPVTLPDPVAPGRTADVELRVPAGGLGLSSADTAWGPRGLSVEVLDDGGRVGIARTFVLWRPTEDPVTPTRMSVLVPLTGGPVDPATAVPRPTGGPQSGDTGSGDPETEDAGATADATDGGARSTDEAGPDPSTEDADPDAGTGTGTGTDAPATTDGTEGTDEPTPTPSATPDDPATGLGAPDGDELDRLDAVVDATAGQPAVSWAVDPAMIAAARAASAGSPAQRWAAALTDAAAGREVVALPARDPDLAALAHGGGSGLAAEAYARARAASDPVVGAAPRADLAWPADAVPDLDTVALGARAGATAVLVGGDGLGTDRLTYSPTGRASVPTPDGTVAALVADRVLTDELRSPSDDTAATAAQRMLAESAVITRERPTEQRHLLLAPPRTWDPDPGVARAQLAALATAPWVELSGLSALLGAAVPDVARTPLPDRQVGADEIPPGDITALVRARTELAAFAGIVADPARLLRGADDAVLAPTSVAWRVDPVQRSLVVDGVVADLTARRSGVTAVPGSDLYLGSEVGRFPIGLRNDLDQDVTVQVAVVPASPVLRIDRTETVTIPAGSETQVRVPFHAVGSGDVRVDVTLLSPDGTPLGPPQRLTVRVRADWENVGTAVVAGLLGLALVVGIVRTIRRGQTRTRGAGSTPVSEIARLPEDPT